MSNEPLNSTQAREVGQIAELETRRYFDRYLTTVWPVQQKAMREHTAQLVRQHDDSDVAHGAIERKFSRVMWTLVGAAMAGGAGGAGLMKALLEISG